MKMEGYMTALFKKLNFKGQPHVLALNVPESFNAELVKMSAYAKIIRRIDDISEVEFAIVFVTKQHEIDQFANAIFPNLKGDAVWWFCYPKGSSKKYQCDINRDKGWDILGQLGFEGVRQVAIDEDWSALRFRKTEYIKSLTRDKKRLLSNDGKLRTKNKMG